jgi:hypothetical protein
MAAWGIVGRKPQAQQKVTTGRFEIERDGQVASLEYSMTGNVLGLIQECRAGASGLGPSSKRRKRLGSSGSFPTDSFQLLPPLGARTQSLSPPGYALVVEATLAGPLKKLTLHERCSRRPICRTAALVKNC